MFEPILAFPRTPDEVGTLTCARLQKVRVQEFTNLMRLSISFHYMGKGAKRHMPTVCVCLKELHTHHRLALSDGFLGRSGA